MTGSGPLVGDKVNYLFEHRRREDGRRYTLAQVVTAIESYGEVRVGESYLCRIRKRPERHPDGLSTERRAAIARFFRVDPAYFDPSCPTDRPPWLELQSTAAGSQAHPDAPTAAAPEDLMLIYGRALEMSPLERQVWLEMADLVKRVAAAATPAPRLQ